MATRDVRLSCLKPRIAAVDTRIASPPPKTKDPFYSSPEWLALRERVLERDRRKCTEPGCGKRASHVDHIVPRRMGGEDVEGNLTSLCWSHHSSKTASRDGGFGNPVR